VTRILILWLLGEQPLHGYRIQKLLSAPGRAFWFRVEDASIYSMLRTLTKQGFTRAEEGHQDSDGPRRTIYGITPDGRRELRRCLEATWQTASRGQDPICAALAAIDAFESDEIDALMAARQDALEGRRDRLAGVERSAPSGLLARREAAMIDAEINWIARETGSRDR
jgi:DNA-binding PadR family transcriptional regulator